MKRLFICLVLGLSMLESTSQVRPKTGTGIKRIRLPNGWSLTPAGQSLPLGDLPLNIAVSSSRKWMAVTNNGQSTQSIQLIDVVKQRVADNIIIPKSWVGLRFTRDEKYLYASAGNDNQVLQYEVRNHKLVL